MREALRAGRPIRKIQVAEGAHVQGALAEIIELAREGGVRLDRVPKAALDTRARGGMHQGVIADTEAVRVARSWRQAVEAAKSTGAIPLVVALDGIQDPQNLGAIARSAEVMGAHGLIVPERRSAPLTAAAARAAAGALEHLPVTRVSNLGRSLQECKAEGLWVVALDQHAEMPVEACELLSEPVVVVIGAEGAGVSRSVRSLSDAVVTIPTTGRIESLNASAAAAICLWEISRRRRA